MIDMQHQTVWYYDSIPSQELAHKYTTAILNVVNDQLKLRRGLNYDPMHGDQAMAHGNQDIPQTR